MFQLICATRKLLEGRKEEAARIYEEGLQVFAPLFSETYLTAYVVFRLALIYKDIQHSLQALNILSVLFPLSHTHALCLTSLAALYRSLDQKEQVEANYLNAMRIYSVHFPFSSNYALCL